MKFVHRRKLLVASITTALLATLVLGGLALRIRWQAAQQARLAQHLGQEITKMEWVLRSARQLPLHDLEREKRIVRQRMAELHLELSSYGPLSQGLAHYALGRGHMALHEYAPALTELGQALSLGAQGADIDYAFGFVLGKHFEQAMAEARLSGTGDWAGKQLKELEPKYLSPAIAALLRSRATKLDAPQYLEGLISYYQRDYDAALKQAAVALQEAPWLYEASKLAGDVHLEKAIRARDTGHYEDAETAFAESVRAYEAAASVGQSDSEVYEGLAEAWVRQIEMAVNRGKSSETAYTAAMRASDKIEAAEPQGVAGPLKKALASAMVAALLNVGRSSKWQECLASADRVLRKQPQNPYASDAAATCYISRSLEAKERGEDPVPALREAQSLLDAAVKIYPHFLWGLMDLGTVHVILGTHLQTLGQPAARGTVMRALEHYAAAAELDPFYENISQNRLGALGVLLPESRSEIEVKSVLAQADDALATCRSINSRSQQCFNNYFQIYARAADLAFRAGQDAQPRLARALEYLMQTRKLGGSFLDAEQHAALVHLTLASAQVRSKQDPGRSLAALQEDLTRCFAVAAKDAMCQTLDARAALLQSEWLAGQGKSETAQLAATLAKALLAARNSAAYPDAWQTLAAVHLRIARSQQRQRSACAEHIAAGLVATTQAFSINPNHPLGLATQGALYLLRAQTEPDAPARRLAAQAAAKSLEQARRNDPFLPPEYAALLDAAAAL